MEGSSNNNCATFSRFLERLRLVWGTNSEGIVASYRGGEVLGGLVIDIYLVYLYRACIRLFRFFQSQEWDRVVASLTDWTVVDPFWGGPSLKVYYEFTVNGHLITGQDEFSFFMPLQTTSYAKSLSRGLPSIIRVNPKNAKETRYFDHDQKTQAEMRESGLLQ